MEPRASRQSRGDAAAISEGERSVDDRRLEVRHDYRARKAARRVSEDVRQRSAIAHVQMPVIRSDDVQTIHLLSRIRFELERMVIENILPRPGDLGGERYGTAQGQLLE